MCIFFSFTNELFPGEKKDEEGSNDLYIGFLLSRFTGKKEVRKSISAGRRSGGPG